MTSNSNTFDTSNLTMTFDDEFNTFQGSSDGTQGWMTRLPYYGRQGRNLSYNNEAEFYGDANNGVDPFSDSNGILDITATKVAASSNPYGLTYNSGAISSYSSFSQEYGYFEINAEMPAGAGLWPAFWLMPENQSLGPVSELDIFEVLENNPSTLYFTAHGTTTTQDKLSVANTTTGFHTYGVDWEPDTITLYIDGVKVASMATPATMDTPMYMIANLAVGGTGSWPGAPTSSTAFPAQMQINYIRAYATANTVDVGGYDSLGGPAKTIVGATSVGTGSDKVVLTLAEQAYLGVDATFSVSINGVVVSANQTVTALEASNNAQNFAYQGDFGATPTIVVTLTNPTFEGQASTDQWRNLYIDGLTYDGQTYTGTTGELTTAIKDTYTYTIAPNLLAGASTTTTPPPTVAITSQVLAHDTGISATDNVTNNGAVTLTGTVTGAAGTTVQIMDGTAALGNATLDGKGGWTYKTTLASGANSLYAIATDPSANTATTAAGPTITVDTTPPSGLAITYETLTHDTGASATDDVTSNGALTLTGRVEAIAGTTIEIYDNGIDLGSVALPAVVGTPVANSTNIWTYNTTLGAGTHNITAVATDLAGNKTTVAAAKPIIVDITAPVVAITSQVLAHDTGASGTDGITSNGTVTLTGTVEASAGMSVAIYDSNNANLGNATVNGTGGWTFTTTLAVGTHALRAVAADLAGNTTTTASQSVLTVETAAPTAAITAAAVTSTADIYNLTGTFSGATGTTVEIFDGSNALGAATLNNKGSWTYAATLSSGTNILTAVATDLAGNTTVSASSPVTILNAAPPTVKPTVAITSEVLAHDTGASATDNNTSNGAVTLTGTMTGATGTVVKIMDGATALGNATLNGSGGWTFATTLAGGTHSLQAVASDASGNTAYSAFAKTIIVDTTPPAAAITSQVLAQDTGASATDNLTTNGAVTLAGTVSTGSGTTVAIMDGTTVLGNATLNGTGGWTYSTTLGIGTHALHVVATDLAGNSTTTAAAAPITVEAATVLPAVSMNTAVSNYTTATSSAPLALSGTYSGMAGTVVEIFDGATELGTAALDGSGGWTYAATLAPGAQVLKAVAVDSAGNTASSGKQSITVTAPTSVTLPALGSGTDTLVLNLSEDAYLGNAQFRLTVNGTQVGYYYTVSALKSLGESQDFSLTGNFGTGPLTVGINFINDFYKGSALDRNLYVNAITLDGTTTVENGSQLASGLVNYSIQNTPAASGTTITPTVNRNVITGLGVMNVLVGNANADTYVQKATDLTDTIINGSAAGHAPVGQLNAAVAHDQLWFQKSGNDLVIETLGTRQETVIKNWYAGAGGQQLASILGNDGYKLDTSVQNLVQAMASFSAANGGFNAQATTHTSLTDSYFGSVATAVASDWHK